MTVFNVSQFRISEISLKQLVDNGTIVDSGCIQVFPLN